MRVIREILIGLRVVVHRAELGWALIEEHVINAVRRCDV